jgi:hypothetical protein
LLVKRIVGRCLVLLLIGFSAAEVESHASCRRLSAENVGTRFGTVLVEIARAFVQAGIWDDPDCDSAGTKELRHLCSLTGNVDDAVERINRSIEQGCFDEAGAYTQTADFYIFQALRTTLESPEPNLRWQGLKLAYYLCDDAHLLTETGVRECAREVEEGALHILKTDETPFNRHLALEILGSGLASERSRETLVGLTRTGSDRGETCPHGLTLASETDSAESPWDVMARDFAKGKYRCEQQLAREALDRLDRGTKR